MITLEQVAYTTSWITVTFQEVDTMFVLSITYLHMEITSTVIMMWTATDGLTAATFMGATVKIGFLNDATGPIAVYAMGFVAASQIAVGMANTIGWNSMVQFEIVYADSGCSGDMGATAAQTLVDAGVVGVVGAACSGASMAANAVFLQQEFHRFPMQVLAQHFQMQQLTLISSV